jgi:hypothetical protein
VQKEDTPKQSQQTASPANVPTLAVSLPTADPLLTEALESLSTPLEAIIAQSLHGAQQELEESIQGIKPFPASPNSHTGPGQPTKRQDEQDALDGDDPAEWEFSIRCAIATRWGLPKLSAPSVAQHLTMLDRLTYCAMTGQDPTAVADPEQLTELLPIAQLTAAAITRLMSKTQTKENDKS